MAATKKAELIEIKPIEMKKVTLKLVGDTPMIMHSWSVKAKREMLEAQQGKSKGKKKEPKNPVYDFIESMYWITGKPEVENSMPEEDCEKAFMEAIENGATFGFPVTAFKQAAISAAYRMGWSKDKMSLRGVFYIDANEDGLVEIKSDTPILREDCVRIGNGSADLRYRGEFRNWSAELTISFNKNGNYSLENIVNIINAGGLVCGVGEWRPERDGQYGMYHVQPNK